MEVAVINHVGGTLQPLLGKLGHLLDEEFQQLHGVPGEVAHFRDELATMNALLRTLTEAGDNVDHLTREWMKQVRELAYDAEDCIDVFELRISRAPPSPWWTESTSSAADWWTGPMVDCVDVLGHCLHLLATLGPRRMLAADIKALRARALAVSERRTRYSLDRTVLDFTASYGARIPAEIGSGGDGAGRGEQSMPAAGEAAVGGDGSGHGEADGDAAKVGGDAAEVGGDAAEVDGGRADGSSQYVGIEYQTTMLANWVTEEAVKLKVISIVGFGGLGKTTLATEVCRRVRQEFQVQASVSVSQTWDLRDVLRRILKQVVDRNEDAMDVNTLCTNLRDHLKAKRYLIVLDDVWTVAAWEAIRWSLPENDRKSSIIVTTRIETVAKVCSFPHLQYVHKIKHLNLPDSKKLLNNRIFGSNGTCPSNLENVSSQILKKCGGLPLAIISIAGLLVSKPVKSVEVWQRVYRSIGSELESNPTLEGMKQILTLSYNNLPHHLKTCFLYLSIFPEDYEIRKERLLHRWIAEGFILEKRGLALLEVAEGYFDELISRSIVQPADVNLDGTVKSCRVHDMMLEVLVSKSLDANFVTLIGDKYGVTLYDTVRRLSIHDDGLTSGVEGLSLSHVRSLTTFRSMGHLVRNVAKLGLLRVLDLEGCKGMEDHHMKNVCKLFQLRFLSLRDTDVRDVPREISMLQHLQTLDLKRTNLYKLPESITKVKKLEHLIFRHKQLVNVGWMLPQGIGNLKSLCTVRKVYIGNDPLIVAELGKLTQLQNLYITINTCKTDVLGEFLVALSKMFVLRKLTISVEWDGRELDRSLDFLHQDQPSSTATSTSSTATISSRYSSMALAIQQPQQRAQRPQQRAQQPQSPPLLHILKLRGPIKNLSGWIESLTNLVKIQLSGTGLRGDGLLGVLHRLPSLLTISMQWGVYKDKELVARANFKFPTLKVLSIYDQREPLSIKFEGEAMPMLERLIVRCTIQRKSLIGMEHLTSLKEVKLLCVTLDKKLVRMVDELKIESTRYPNNFKIVVETGH